MRCPYSILKTNYQPKDQLQHRKNIKHLCSWLEINEKVDARTHECKISPIFSLSCIIQVDTTTCTEMNEKTDD